jgi:hypothetical protein
LPGPPLAVPRDTAFYPPVCTFRCLPHAIDPEIGMSFLRPRFVWCLLSAVVAGAIWPAIGGESAFPFDRELMLDVSPMRGSKRIPILEIAENGAASIQLWCSDARAQANVGAESITIVPGAVQSGQCPPERKRVTTICWRRSRRSRTGGAAATSLSFSAVPRCVSA